MSEIKYIISEDGQDSSIPKFLWFSKKYKVYPNLFVGTENWKKIVPDKEAARKPSGRNPRPFKKVARSVILSQRLGRGFEAKLKGATLKQCQLPAEAELDVANLMKWDVVTKNVRIEDESLDNDLDEKRDIDNHPLPPVKSADKKQQDQPKSVQESPYLAFLELVSGEEVEADQNNLLGGLQSWLGFAGSLGGTEMANMANVGVETSGIRWRQIIFWTK